MERPASASIEIPRARSTGGVHPWAVRMSWVLLALLMLLLCLPLGITAFTAALSELPEQRGAQGPLAFVSGTFRGVKRVLEEEPPGRQALKEVYDRVRIETLKSSPNPKVVVGSDEWLFFLEPDSGLPTYVHDRPLAPEDLAQWQRVIEQRVKFFAQRGVTYLLVMAPSKSSVQGPAHLPTRIQPRSARGRFDQIVEGLSPAARAHVLDLRSTLREQAQHTDNYYRLDSHWNDAGAYLAYGKMVGRIAELADAEGRPLPMDWARPVAVNRTRVPAERNDLAAMLNHPRFMTEWTTALTPKDPAPARFLVPMDSLSTLRDPRVPADSNFHPYGRRVETADAQQLPRCVAFRDSFFHIMEPFFAHHCQRLILLKHLDKLETPALSLDMKVLAAERPQVVVEEFVERLLNRSYALPPRSLSEQDGEQFGAPVESHSLR